MKANDQPGMRLLVSVRDPAEALLAAEHGANFIDLKEPRGGALGGLPVAQIQAIVQALRAADVKLPVSATIGDLPMQALDAIEAQARAVADCRVDYVKVGIEPEMGAAEVLQMLARMDHPIVPVFIADRGLDFDLVESACRLGFPGVMADTADKLVGSLFDAVPLDDLARFVATVRGTGRIVGLAGALRLQHAQALKSLAPDFAGFRSAVCETDRGSALNPGRLRALAAAMR